MSLKKTCEFTLQGFVFLFEFLKILLSPIMTIHKLSIFFLENLNQSKSMVTFFNCRAQSVVMIIYKLRHILLKINSHILFILKTLSERGNFIGSISFIFTSQVKKF